MLGETATGKVIQFDSGKKHVAPAPAVQVLSLSKITADYRRLYLRMAKAFTQGGPPPGRRKLLRVMGAYKRKAQRFLPKDVPREDGEGPGGEFNWKAPVLEKEAVLLADREPQPLDKWFIPRISPEPEGSRLTPERMKTLQLGPMSVEEEALLMKILLNREMALAWDFRDMGRIRPEVAPDQEIKTVEHEAWQVNSFQTPKALEKVVRELFKERIEKGTLEECNGPYRNPWFLVRKQNGKHRLINAAMHMNSVTIRDAMIPPSADEFAEDFAGQQVSSYFDFFSGYDQIGLAKTSRDMTAMVTPFGLLRQTTLPQGATNSVAQFQRIMMRILRDLIPDVARAYLDDIGVKGPKTRYQDEEVLELPGVRRFMFEHFRNVDKVLADLERSGATISGEKSKFCMMGIEIVGFVCDAEGRHPSAAKVAAIIEWPEPTNVTEARGFIGVCVYYRIWVAFFAIVSEPIFRLFRTGVIFVWGPEQREAMKLLKVALTSAPALVSIDYSLGAGLIILAVDASLRGWGAVLMQLDLQGRRHPVRYLSGLWSDAEKKYDAGKLECRGVLKALKKVRQYLYGVRFCLELDAKTLIAQLQGGATDLPGALVTRWLAWIRQFDFEVRHVAGRRHTAPDALSRRPPTAADHPDEDEEELEREIDLAFNLLRVHPGQDSSTASVDSLQGPLPEDEAEVEEILPTARVSMVNASNAGESGDRSFKTAGEVLDKVVSHLPAEEISTLRDLLQLSSEMDGEGRIIEDPKGRPELPIRARQGADSLGKDKDVVKPDRQVRFGTLPGAQTGKRNDAGRASSSGGTSEKAKQGWVPKNGSFGIQEDKRRSLDMARSPPKNVGRLGEVRGEGRDGAVKSKDPLPRNECRTRASANSVTRSEGMAATPASGEVRDEVRDGPVKGRDPLPRNAWRAWVSANPIATSQEAGGTPTPGFGGLPDTASPSQTSNALEGASLPAGSRQGGPPGPHDPPGDFEDARELSLAPEYSDHARLIAEYLSSLRKPPELEDLTAPEWQKWKVNALKFARYGSYLYRRAARDEMAPRWVDNSEQQQLVLKELHDESGHRGREGTYRKIKLRYWWPRLWESVKGYVKTCAECQLRSAARVKEELHPTYATSIWERWGLDVVHMPSWKGYQYMVLARDDLSGWAEGRALRHANSTNISDFLRTEVICRHGLFGRLVVDGGPENKEKVDEAIGLLSLQKVTTSPYHPQANGMVERGHKPVVDALAKMKREGREDWVSLLPAALWADRVTVTRKTGMSPYRFLHGIDPIMPVEAMVSTRAYEKWQAAVGRDDVLAIRIRQLERLDEDRLEGADRQRRMREEAKEYFDDNNTLRAEPLHYGDFVLLHNTQRMKDMARVRKLKWRWLGPYKIAGVNALKGNYKLQELDDTMLGGVFAGDRLKRFHVRPGREDDLGAVRRRTERFVPELDEELEPAEPSGSQMVARTLENEDGGRDMGEVRRSARLGQSQRPVVEVSPSNERDSLTQVGSTSEATGGFHLDIPRFQGNRDDYELLPQDYRPSGGFQGRPPVLGSRYEPPIEWDSDSSSGMLDRDSDVEMTDSE